MNHPKKNGLDQKYSISLDFKRMSVHNVTDCPEEAAVMELLDVEVTKEMFLSLSRGNMVVVASPETKESCQVCHIFSLKDYMDLLSFSGVTCGSSSRIGMGQL